MNRRLAVALTRLRYRLHGGRYGHSALSDPGNVQFVVVCPRCDASQPGNLCDTCATCGRALRSATR